MRTMNDDTRETVFTACGRLYELIEDVEDEELSKEMANKVDTIEGAVGAPERVREE